MDPLTALGIACNVMQVISFAHEVASAVKQLKKDGSVDPKLREHAGNLSATSEQLNQSLSDFNATPISKPQADLRDIATKCLQTSTAMQSKLDQIDSNGRGPIMKVFKMKWKMSELQKLENDMQKYQDGMQTRILVYLCSQQDATSLEQNNRFQNMTGDLQKLIKSYMQGQTQITNLVTSEFWVTRGLISDANEAIKHQIETQHNHVQESLVSTQNALESQRQNAAIRKQLLESLADPEMNTRRNQIVNSHENTFSWIFDEETHKPWDDFTGWLKSQDSLYWICGKAGSGKSTVMKFLVSDRRTKQQLQKRWPDCIIYSHFIWNSGTIGQRSSDGLLRSLLYQIFQANEYLVDNLLENQPDLSRTRSPGDWSRLVLKDILFQSLSSHKQPVCIFVDGLDEIDQKEGPFDLLDLVKQISSLSSTNDLKLCVSSRPEASFKNFLTPYPKLSLQDLTKYDMEIYTKDFLQTKCTFNMDGIDESEFISDVVIKADGVFLWVSLALKSLQRGIVNGDNLATLKRRLDTLPSDLENFYDEMLNRLGDDRDLYRQEAALIFNIFLLFSYGYLSEQPNLIHGQPIYSRCDILQFTAALNPTVKDIILSQGYYAPAKSLKRAIIDVERQLASQCGGILELVYYGNEEHNAVEDIIWEPETEPWRTIRIGLIHRSAKDFLINAKTKILSYDKTSPAEKKFRVLQALALQICLARQPSKWYAKEFSVMRHIANNRFNVLDEERLDILRIFRDMYRRIDSGEFYDTAAKLGILTCYINLLDGEFRTSSAVRNYLLLCSTIKCNMGSVAMVTYLLGRGANPNYMGVDSMIYYRPHRDDKPTTREEQRIWFPTPLLAYSDILAGSMDPGVQTIISTLLQFGVDLDRKFLCPEFIRNSYYDESFMSCSRPRYRARYADYFPSLIIEANCACLFLYSFSRANIGEPRKSTIISALDLWMRSHCRVLLCIREDAIYEVNDEVSDVLKDRPAIQSPDDMRDFIEGEIEKRLQIPLESSMEKEVYNIRQYLADRGHKVLDETDLEGISENTPLEKMAEIYEELNKRFWPQAEPQPGFIWPMDD